MIGLVFSSIMISPLLITNSSNIRLNLSSRDLYKNIMVFKEYSYGGADSDEAYSLISTQDGGYALVGLTKSYGEGEADFWLIKTDNQGVVQWNQTYGGPSFDVAYSVIQTEDYGFALAGRTSSYGSGYNDFWLVKTDTKGKAQWNRTYGGENSDELRSAIHTQDGGFVLVGYTESYGAGGWDFWLLKTDVNGIIQWNQTYGGSANEWAQSVTQTPDLGYIITGFKLVQSDSTTNYDIWVVKTDPFGIAQWNYTYGGSADDQAHSIIQTQDNGLAIVGYTSSFGAGKADMWLLKTDANGIIQWNQTYGGSSDDVAYNIIQNQDDTFTLIGYTFSYGMGENDMWLVTTDYNGEVQSNQTYGGPRYDEAYSLIEINAGSYAIVGYTTSFGEGKSDMWLVMAIGQNKTDQSTKDSVKFSSLTILVTFMVLILLKKKKKLLLG